MSSEPVLLARGLCKNFRLYRRVRHRFLEMLTQKSMHRDFCALKDISFTLESGKILGILGENGSGKSTLLKLVAGVLLPDAGEIIANGKITGILELGAGFNPELSGRRNIAMNAIYLDIDRRELADIEKPIIEFAELGDFIDEPLKNYSSGMAMRLAFSVAIHARPRCFIIDEALSVGDARFQQKCFARLRRFRESGGSILFVSHDINAVKLLCDEAMLLAHGRMQYLGSPDDAVNMYNEILAQKGESGHATATGYGNSAIYFTSAEILDAAGRPALALNCGSAMQIRFAWNCRQKTEDVTFGFVIRDRFGQDVFGTNGALLGRQISVKEAGCGVFRISALNIAPGVYTVSLAAHTGDTHLENCFHWWDNAAVFEVVRDDSPYFAGHTRLDARLDFDVL